MSSPVYIPSSSPPSDVRIAAGRLDVNGANSIAAEELTIDYAGLFDRLMHWTTICVDTRHHGSPEFIGKRIL